MKIKIVATILLLHLLIPCFLFGQISGPNKVVQGTVSSETDGETLAGATVVERDSKNRIINATITDVNGHYVLKIKNPENKLIFSFVGL